MNRHLTAVLGLALLAIACNPAGAAPAGLEGRAFLSVDITVNGIQQQLVPGTRIRLSFQDGNLGAHAGCNSMGGDYRIESGRLIVDSLGMTEMGCDADRHAQDTELARLLTARPQIRLNGPEMIIDDGNVVLRLLDDEVADPDRPLDGTRWTLTTLFEGEAASSVPEGVVATLELSADGNFSLHAGCNQGGGRYTREGSTITFSDVVTTDMACQDARGQVEQAVLAVIGAGQLSYTIDGASLTLDAGARGLGFSAP